MNVHPELKPIPLAVPAALLRNVFMLAAAWLARALLLRCFFEALSAISPAVSCGLVSSSELLGDARTFPLVRTGEVAVPKPT